MKQMTKRLTGGAAILYASASFCSAAVVYTETFENGSTSDTSFGDHGWKASRKDGSQDTNNASNPARVTYSPGDIEGDQRTFVGSANAQTQWLVSDMGTITQTISEVSFQHRESGVQLGEGYRLGFQIGGSWYIQDDVIAGSSSLTTAVVDITATSFVLWGDAPANDSTAWASDPATGGGAALISDDVTGFGIMLIQSDTSDQFRFDDIKVSAVPEPSSAALLGLGALALIMRRRK